MRCANETNAKGVVIRLRLTEALAYVGAPAKLRARRILIEHPKLKTHVRRLGIEVKARKISGQSELYSFHIHVRPVDALHLYGLFEIPLARADTPNP